MYRLASDGGTFDYAMTTKPVVTNLAYVPGLKTGTMAPSHLVDRFFVEALPDEDIIYEAAGDVQTRARRFQLVVQPNLELVRYQKEHLGDDYPKDALEGETRLILVHSGGLYNDDLVKRYRYKKYRECISQVIEHTKNVGMELAYDYVQHQMCEHGEWTRAYITGHPTSSVIPKTKWPDLLRLRKVDELHRFCSDFLGVWRERFFEPGDWRVQTYFVGNRGRSPPRTRLGLDLDVLLARIRRVGYTPPVSDYGAFSSVDAEHENLQRMFSYFEKRLGIKVYCPKLHGGTVYTMLQNALLEKKSLLHFDVKGMELITIPVIAGSFHIPFGIGVAAFQNGDICELLSGVAMTSDWDMLAHLLLIVFLIEKGYMTRPEFIVILGDDATWVGARIIKKFLLYEQQVDDDRVNRTLGLVIGPKLMRPIGFNITVDNVDKRIPILKEGSIIRNRMPLSERKAIAELYCGFVNGVSLAEVLAREPNMGRHYSVKSWVMDMVKSREMPAEA